MQYKSSKYLYFFCLPIFYDAVSYEIIFVLIALDVNNIYRRDYEGIKAVNQVVVGRRASPLWLD